MHRAMSRYSSQSDTDVLAKAYIDTAKSRGNTVRLYRPSITRQVNALFKQPFAPGNQTAEWYDKDVLLAEYENNRPKSILIRAHQAQITLGANSRMYSSVLIGMDTMRHFESRIGNNQLSDALIAEL